MPQTSTGVAGTSVAAACTVPAANDLVTGAGLKTMADSIENDISTIASGNVTIAGNKSFSGTLTFSPAVSITRTSRAAPFVLTGTWTRDLVTNTGALVSSGTGAVVCFDIDPPHGSGLGSVTVWLIGSSGHIGLPGTVPSIDVRRIHMTGGGVTSLGTQSDTSLNTTVYEQAHQITATGLAATVDRSAYRYMVTVADESGAGSQAGLVVYGCSFTYAVSPIGLD